MERRFKSRVYNKYRKNTSEVKKTEVVKDGVKNKKQIRREGPKCYELEWNQAQSQGFGIY